MVDRVILAHIDSIDTSARRCLRLELVKGKYLGNMVSVLS
jgi:hypothetical protein